MSTGIGKHQYSTNHRDVYHPDLAICPYCGFDSCEADHCDVGIGMVQCGPYYCPQCEASEISSLDKRELTAREKETGWFQPGSPVSDVANTVNGQLVNHKEAKQAYDIGLLDVKKYDRETITVTHNGKQYTASKLNDNEWKLSSVDKPRETLTMDRAQMAYAGLLEQVEGKS